MIKVAILGPESTGKTELASQLAKHFKSPWVPEYAREYVENLKIPYTFDDVCNIALKQIEEEKYYENVSQNERFVFFDTDLIITKVWFEYCFKKIPEFLTDRMKSNYYDLYLLCTPDLPWEPDSVREHGNDREFFFEWYRREIEQTNKPYVIIDKTGFQRTQKAINALEILK